jgi:subtilisin
MKTWITPQEASQAILRGRGRGIRIAVLDSGIEASHPALGGLHLADDVAIVEDGLQLKAADGAGTDLFGHGTAVAGIIRSAAPEAEIGSFRVLGEALSSRTAIILEGARLAIEKGYHILNCSIGCAVPEHVLKYKSWVDEAYLRGVHVVAACNNHDFSRPEWPGFFTSVLTVNMARTEENSDIFYRHGHLVEFAARGVNVEVPWRGGGMKKVTGSSFAAPRVAGMLACLLSEVPKIPPLQAKALFHQLARPWNQEFLAPNESAASQR